MVAFVTMQELEDSKQELVDETEAEKERMRESVAGILFFFKSVCTVFFVRFGSVFESEEENESMCESVAGFFFFLALRV